MDDKLELPIIPTVDIYTIRCISNNIQSFNKNIISYDYNIFSRVQKIAIRVEKLNTVIRNFIPILKIKLKYILTNEVNILAKKNHQGDSPLPTQLDALTKNFTDDLVDLQLELEKLINQINYTLESLTILHLDEPNKLKYSQFEKQKEALLNFKGKKQSKIDELNENLSTIVAAEEIILKNNLTNFFDKYFQEKELIDSIDISPNKKDILKLALSYIRNLLSMIDDGLEFHQLVDVRLYLNDQLVELREEVNTIDTNIFSISQLMSLSNEIGIIDTQKELIIAQTGKLKDYWRSWSLFINQKVYEQPINLVQIKTTSQVLMNYLNDIEHQYQRQLPE